MYTEIAPSPSFSTDGPATYSIDFEDTYDGLGDQLDEDNDDFNDDTFGGAGGTSEKAPAKDFDFFGNTSKVSDAINEEAVRFNRQHVASKPLVPPSDPKPAKKPFKTGYEAYNPVQVANLQADPSLWGTAPPVPSSQQQPPTVFAPEPQHATAASKKMMSLEEIESMMFPQSKATPQPQIAPQRPQTTASDQMTPAFANQLPQTAGLTVVGALNQPFALMQQAQTDSVPQGLSTTIKGQDFMQGRQASHRSTQQPRGTHVELPAQTRPDLWDAPQNASAHSQHRPRTSQHQIPTNVSQPQPRQILQNPNRQSLQPGNRPLEPELPVLPPSRMVGSGPGGAPVSLPIITHPSQLKDLTEEQRQAFMLEDAKRAKRNHKIFLLSKDNGLMTPQDKNFITRIQLQQLMTATGNVNEKDSDVVLSEDFYYQVYNQIENRPRLNPHQPLSNFAQTYLFQTGNRQGGMGRRINRGGDTHMHRMQQQVQRAVEAAKAKPKGKQLVIEGSLGKISFSNAKTPKPLLNIKRNDSKIPQATLSSTDRKAILKNIEAVYNTLMKMEDHERRQPPHTDDSDTALSEAAAEWRQTFQDLNHTLWDELKVMEPIMPESTVLHPFIAFLSYPKGKKAIPRIFSQIDAEQRLTILTIIMVQLDTLDVIRSGLPQFSGRQSPSVAREQVDLFVQTVMPTLFSYVTKAPLGIIIGLVGLLLDRVNVQAIAHTRVGLEILTMLLSQAEIIRKSEATNEQEWEQWLSIFNRLFDTAEPVLAEIFPGAVSAGQDVYVWQFLATLGTGASPDQQQRLVIAVK